MATKTITIDLEAYERLAAVRRDGESFSRAIKRVVRQPFDVDSFLRGLADRALSDQAVAAVEEQVANRRRPSHRER